MARAQAHDSDGRRQTWWKFLVNAAGAILIVALISIHLYGGISPDTVFTKLGNYFETAALTTEDGAK